MAAFLFLVMCLVGSALAAPPMIKPDIIDDVNKLAASSAGLADQTGSVADAVTKTLMEAEKEVKDKEEQAKKAVEEKDAEEKNLKLAADNKKKEAEDAVVSQKGKMKAQVEKEKGDTDTLMATIKAKMEKIALDKSEEVKKVAIEYKGKVTKAKTSRLSYKDKAVGEIKAFHMWLVNTFDDLSKDVPMLASSFLELVPDVIDDVKSIAKDSDSLAKDTKKVAEAIAGRLKETAVQSKAKDEQVKKAKDDQQKEVDKVTEEVKKKVDDATKDLVDTKQAADKDRKTTADSAEKQLGIIREQGDAGLEKYMTAEANKIEEVRKVVADDESKMKKMKEQISSKLDDLKSSLLKIADEMIAEVSGPTIEPPKIMVREEEKVGGYVDEKGCRPSAGYTWSEPHGKCIQPWNPPPLEMPRVMDGVMPPPVMDGARPAALKVEKIEKMEPPKIMDGSRGGYGR